MSESIDLSLEAIQRRQAAERRGQGHGGLTGRQLVASAAARLKNANRKMRIAAGRSGARADRAVQQAKHEALNAAVQIRIAERVPADQGYLHHMTIQQIQACEAEARKIVADNDDEAWAALAVDTHRRVQQERTRHSHGG